MAKPNNLCCILDSDVLLNWLTQEEDPLANIILWDAPHKIMRLIEYGSVEGHTTLINLMEIRFVLRRKKGLSERTIRELLNKLLLLVKVIIPDEINLLEAHGLQEEIPLSPVDAIILGVASSLKDRHALLITRDKELASASKGVVTVLTPENFLKTIK